MNQYGNLQGMMDQIAAANGAPSKGVDTRAKISRLSFSAMLKAQRESCTCGAATALREAADLIMDDDVPEVAAVAAGTGS